jgi:hypothetical protein
MRIFADLLRSISERTEQIGAILCADPDFIGQHIQLLQEIDALAQRQATIAAMLEAENLEQSLQACRLEWVAEAFRAPSDAVDQRHATVDRQPA